MNSSNENKEKNLMDILSTAFNTQVSLTDKSKARTTPPLRKRSSSNLLIRQDAKETSRRRDSTGINYSNFIFALSEYNNEDQPPLFTLKKRDEDDPLIHTNDNRGRISKRQSLSHASNTNTILKSIQSTSSLDPHELATLFDAPPHPLLIDMRPLDLYEKSRIRQSIHINVPTLLIKRYRKGVVSNFNLESFISTSEGIGIYKAWLDHFKVTDIQQLPSHAHFVIYDSQMLEQDKSNAPAWVLLGVLQKNTNSMVHWLKNGFDAFEKWDFTHKFIDYMNPSETPPLPIPKKKYSFLSNPPNKLKLPTPMISKSASTISSANSAVDVQRRASLFNLDTRNIKSSISNTKNSVAQPISEQSIFSPSTEDQFHTPHEVLPQSSSSEEMVTALVDLTPKTENEYDFVVSEIIPHFLYLGPEIVTTEQLVGLERRSIKRILNMAEECDDDVPGLKARFNYQKIAARDTVEMQNVQGTLKKAVHVINDAKKHHEPIYVHCKAGKSRSAAAILAYLVISEKWTLKRAYQHIVKARPNISPNIGFVAELMKMEQKVHGQVSNFVGLDWTQYPSSPDTQKELSRLEKAWKRGSRSLSSDFE